MFLIPVRFLWNVFMFSRWRETETKQLPPMPGYRLVEGERVAVPLLNRWRVFLGLAWRDAVDGIWWSRRGRKLPRLKVLMGQEPDGEEGEEERQAGADEVGQADGGDQRGVRSGDPRQGE